MRQPETSELSLGLWAPKIQPRIRPAPEQRDPLPSEAQVLEILGELSELLGPGRCARAYQLYAPEDLPEEWERELVDQRALIRRLLRYAGHDDRSFAVHLTDGRDARSEQFGDHLTGNLAYVGLTNTDEAAAHFLVLDLGDFRAMLGPTCVEVARALVHRARIDVQARGYRGDEALDPAGVDLPTELEGFLACFALGWGVPVTNACLDSRSAGSMQGGWNGTAWVAASLSFPPELGARLLAMIYRAGAQPPELVATRRAALNPSQRELFDAANAPPNDDDDDDYDDYDDADDDHHHDHDDESLRRILRWGHPRDWPPARDRALDELEYDDHDEALAAEQAAHAARQRLPNLGAFVFRARPRRTLQLAVLGGLVGVLFGGLGSILGTALGALLGSKIRRSICSGPRCGAPLALDATECGSCGGTIAGEIDQARDHLAALEDLENKVAAGEDPVGRLAGG